MVELPLSYYPDITQKQTEADVQGAVEVFAGALASQLTATLGRRVAVPVLPVLSVPDQYRAVLDGGSPIALMKPVAYVFAHRRRAGIVPACVALRPIDGEVGNTYYAQVYARRDLGISSLTQLAGSGAERLHVAYGSRYSTSNFLIPANILAGVGVHPFLFFRSATFFGGHDLAAEAVYEGRADIGCGHDGVIKILAQSHPDAEEALVPLGREDIHSDPVVVDADALPDGVDVAAIQAACIEICREQRVLDALDLFWGWVRGLGPTAHANYASIERALQRLSLTEADMVA